MLADTTADVKNASPSPAIAAELCAADLPLTEPCVICLEHIHDKATALPCRHEQFHFSCLGTWTQQQRVCPLCKAEIRSIKYASNGNAAPASFFYFAVPRRDELVNNSHHGRTARIERYRSHQARRRQARSSRDALPTQAKHDAIEFRRRVYRDALYSSHVGVNRISRYQNITPKAFQDNHHLVSRAKMFIRRELSVFDFLNPGRGAERENSLFQGDRRASNAEFLLEYIISILKSIELRGSTGQAEDLLSEFLGRDHTRLFLHELEAWLKSPYESLEHWDRHVQYNGRRP